MEFRKCNRCGGFFMAEGSVCPKCTPKDNLELSTFKTYIEENGIGESIDTISFETGIATKNINRFLGYGDSLNITGNLGGKIND